MIKKILIGLFLMALLPPPLSAAGSAQFVRTQVLMGDVPVTITLQASSIDRETAFSDMSEAFSLAEEIEAEVSEFRSTSQTSRLNRQTEAARIPIGQHLSHLLRRSRQISLISRGLFDVSFASADSEINFKHILLSPDGRHVLWNNNGMQIRLSGIAKGYIVDRMAEKLRGMGYRRLTINAGGDIWVESPTGKAPWPVSLPRHPDVVENTLCELQLQKGAIASSGNYERGNHLIDPRKRRPAHSPWQMVSVIASDTETADALATAFFVAGHQATELFMEIQKILPDMALLLMDRTGIVVSLGQSYCKKPEIRL